MRTYYLFASVFHKQLIFVLTFSFIVTLFYPHVLFAQDKNEYKFKLTEKEGYYFKDQEALLFSQNKVFHTKGKIVIFGVGESLSMSILTSSLIGGVAALLSKNKQDAFNKWSLGSFVVFFPLSTYARVSSIEKSQYVNYRDKWIKPNDAFLTKYNDYWVLDKLKYTKTWDYIVTENKQELYENFLKNHPVGWHYGEAKFNVNFLKQLKSTKNDTIKALTYLVKNVQDSTVRFQSACKLSKYWPNGLEKLLDLCDGSYYHDSSPKGLVESFVLADVYHRDDKELRDVIKDALLLEVQRYDSAKFNYLISELTSTKHINLTKIMLINLLEASKYNSTEISLLQMIDKETNMDVTVEVVDALGRLNSTAACEKLRELYFKANPPIKAACILSLAKIESDGAFDILMDATSSKKKVVRNAIKEALTYLKNKDFIIELNNKINEKN